MTHICVDELTIIGSHNGMSPGRRQAITWTNVGILWIGTLGTNIGEILRGIQTFLFKKMHLKMSSAALWTRLCKWNPFRRSIGSGQQILNNVYPDLNCMNSCALAQEHDSNRQDICPEIFLNKICSFFLRCWYFIEYFTIRYRMGITVPWYARFYRFTCLFSHVMGRILIGTRYDCHG